MKRILKSISYMAVMATAVMAFSSCEEELPDPIGKPRTAVTIQTDWGSCGLNNAPNSYFLSINDEVSTVSGNTQQLTLKSIMIIHSDAIMAPVILQLLRQELL